MTRMENLEIMETKIENLIKELDVLCPELGFYKSNKKRYSVEKQRLDRARTTGNMNNLTILVDRYEYILGAMNLIRSKY